jgi:hypothetical protein
MRMHTAAAVFGNPTPTTKVGPAQSAVVWLDVALDKGFAVPAELTHVIGVSKGQPVPMGPGITARGETDVSPLTRDVMTYADR